MSFKCVPIYGLMFRILTRFHTLYFGASCIHRNSIVWRRVNLARFPYWPEKRKRRISRYSYLMKTLISSEYGLTISGHVTVLRQWLSEKNTNYIIIQFISVKKTNADKKQLVYLWRNERTKSPKLDKHQPAIQRTICNMQQQCTIIRTVFIASTCLTILYQYRLLALFVTFRGDQLMPFQ